MQRVPTKKPLAETATPEHAAEDLFAAHAQTTQAIRLPLQDAELLFHRHTGIDAEGYMTTLLRDTPWQQESVTLFGKQHLQPRLEAWYGDAGARYTYSGIAHEPVPWTKDLENIKHCVETLSGQRFNSVLLNLYRDGSDAMGLHADDEPELGQRPIIASLSLGAERRTYFRHKRDKALKTFSLDLPSGSLLIMRGETQTHWKHGIRRTARDCGPRINLTFRTIK